jgi:gamma-glutamyltranspeptidase
MQSFVGRRGMAVAPHHLASESALSVLREGGNAIEAMISAAATIAVVYPHMNSVGGDSFWVMNGPGGVLGGIDASGPSARRATLSAYQAHGVGGQIPFRGGVAALTVAGTVDGWRQAHQLAIGLGGRMPMSRLLEDAIWYAEKGVPVTRSQFHTTSQKLKELESVPGFSQTFLVGGQVPPAGTLFKQPRLAETLRRIARRPRDFYDGELARSMSEELSKLGSPIQFDDLTDYRARLVDPLHLQLRHRGTQISNMTPPSQGLVSMMILGILDRIDHRCSDPVGAAVVHAQVEATKLAFRVRDAALTDPSFMKVTPESLLASRSLDELAAQVDMNRAAPWGRRTEPGDTVWMGVVDERGYAVSFIQSIYHEFGSGLVLQSSGVNWQNRGCSFSLDPSHINCLAPRKKPFHTLNAGLAQMGDGSTMVYGSMGGDGQPQTQATLFTRVHRYGLDPQTAVSLPRWLLGRTWGLPSESLKLESRFSPQTIKELRSMGHEVEVIGAFDETVGHAGMIIRQSDGCLFGGFDPRSNGGVAAF